MQVTEELARSFFVALQAPIPASYFLPFATGCGGRVKLSCLDFAVAALPALAASFCF